MQAPSTSITSSDLTTIKFNANLGNTSLLNRLRPLQPGSATISGSWGGSSASGLAISVGGPGAAVTVQSMSLTATWCTSGSSDPQCPVTFAATYNSSQVLEVSSGLCFPMPEIYAVQTVEHCCVTCNSELNAPASCPGTKISQSPELEVQSTLTQIQQLIHWCHCVTWARRLQIVRTTQSAMQRLAQRLTSIPGTVSLAWPAMRSLVNSSSSHSAKSPAGRFDHERRVPVQQGAGSGTHSPGHPQHQRSAQFFIHPGWHSSCTDSSLSAQYPTGSLALQITTPQEVLALLKLCPLTCQRIALKAQCSRCYLYSTSDNAATNVAGSQHQHAA